MAIKVASDLVPSNGLSPILSTEYVKHIETDSTVSKLSDYLNSLAGGINVVDSVDNVTTQGVLYYVPTKNDSGEIESYQVYVYNGTSAELIGTQSNTADNALTTDNIDVESASTIDSVYVKKDGSGKLVVDLSELDLSTGGGSSGNVTYSGSANNMYVNSDMILEYDGTNDGSEGGTFNLNTTTGVLSYKV